MRGWVGYVAGYGEDFVLVLWGDAGQCRLWGEVDDGYAGRTGVEVGLGVSKLSLAPPLELHWLWLGESSWWSR